MTANVLCYSPYTMWTLHGLWEMTALHALGLRGARTRYVLCDGLYSDCDVFWASTNPRTRSSCLQCQAHVSQLMLRMQMPFEWLGRHLHTDDLRDARAWASALPVDALRCARHGDLELGEWVAPSVHSHLRASVLDLENPAIEGVYRSYLYSAAVAARALGRLLDDARPDLLLLFNGRMSSTAVAFHLARRRGIRVVCHERGLLTESLRLFENQTCLTLQPYQQLWRDWGSVPLLRGELEAIHGYLQQRAQGKNMNWDAFSPPAHADVEPLRQELGLRPGRRVWVFFNSSDDEMIAGPEWKGPFASQSEWLIRMRLYARQHPEIDFVLRVHPNVGSKSSNGVNQQQLQEAKELARSAPPNLRVVMPTDPVSSYSLMQLCSAAIVYYSTTGLEMACLGKPVLSCAPSMFRGLPFVRNVESSDGFEDGLDALAALPIEHVDREAQRLAHRFAHALYFRFNLPFPLVKMPDSHTGELTYGSLEDLLPGREPNLDRMARILLQGEPVCPPPGEIERARSDADEREWFGIGRSR
jgi:hypothetical protein